MEQIIKKKIDRYNTYKNGGKKAVANLEVKYYEKIFRTGYLYPIKHYVEITFITAFNKNMKEDFVFNKYKVMNGHFDTKEEAMELVDYINSIKNDYLKTNETS